MGKLFWLGIFFLFFVPFFEFSEKGLGFALLLMGTALICLSFSRKKIIFDIPSQLFLLFLFLSLIGVLTSLSPARSLAEFLRYLAYFFLFVFIRNGQEAQREKWKKVFLGIIILQNLIFSFLTFFFFPPFSPFKPVVDFMNFYYPVAGHNHLAGFLLITLPLLLGLYFDHPPESLRKKLGFFFLFFLFLVSLVASYSRMAFFLVILQGVGFSFWLFKKRKIFGLKLLLTFILVAFFSFQFVFFYSFAQENFWHLPKQLFKPPANPELRKEYFYQAIQGVKLSPFFGTGLDTFRYLSALYLRKKGYFSYSTHNHFLQLLAETGVFGSLIFLFFLVFSFVFIFKKSIGQQNALSFALFLGILGTMLNNLVDYDWQFLSLFLYFFILLAFLLPPSQELKVFSFPSNFLTKLFFVGIFIFGLIWFLIQGEYYRQIKKNVYQPQSVFFLSNLGFWNAYLQQELAFLAFRFKDYSAGFQYLEKAFRLEPFESGFIFSLADWERGLGKNRKALSYYLFLVRHFSHFLNNSRIWKQIVLLEIDNIKQLVLGGKKREACFYFQRLSAVLKELNGSKNFFPEGDFISEEDCFFSLSDSSLEKFFTDFEKKFQQNKFGKNDFSKIKKYFLENFGDNR